MNNLQKYNEFQTKNSFVRLLFGIVFATIFAGVGYTYVETATSSVTICKTCRIQIVPTNDMIYYGYMLLKDISAEQTLTVVNPGNVDAKIKVRATDWLDDSGEIKMYAYKTRYYLTSGDYNSKTELDRSSVLLGGLIFGELGKPSTIIRSLKPQTNTDTFWQLGTDLNYNNRFSGNLTQTLHFSALCRRQRNEIFSSSFNNIDKNRHIP